MRSRLEKINNDHICVFNYLTKDQLDRYNDDQALPYYHRRKSIIVMDR